MAIGRIDKRVTFWSWQRKDNVVAVFIINDKGERKWAGAGNNGYSLLPLPMPLSQIDKMPKTTGKTINVGMKFVRRVPFPSGWIPMGGGTQFAVHKQYV